MVCTGNVAVWDQALGCPECQMNTWEWEGDHSVEEQFERFFAKHPFAFTDAHDDGDEDPRAWLPSWQR